MSNKVRGIILEVLGLLQKNISFEECNYNKTFYDGVKHGIKLSKKVIENISKEELQNKTSRNCIYCKNGTYKIPVTQPNSVLIRYKNFCDECGRDLRNI